MSPGVTEGAFTRRTSTAASGFATRYEQSKFAAEASAARADGFRCRRAAEHHRRRQPQRLDAGVQRHLLAAAGVRLGAAGRDRGRSRGARNRAGRLRGRRDRRGARRPQPCGTVALVAGDRAVTNGELAELAAAAFGRPLPRMGQADAGVLGEGEVYLPYFDVRGTFDDARSRELLGERVPAPGHLSRYFGRIVDYAIVADWGRRR